MFLHIWKCKVKACKLIKQHVKIFVKCKSTYTKRMLFIMEIKEVSAVAHTINKSYGPQSPRKRWLRVLHIFGKLKAAIPSTNGSIFKKYKNPCFSLFILRRCIKYRENYLGIMAFLNDKSGQIYKTICRASYEFYGCTWKWISVT